MAPYVHFTDEQKQRANNIDISDFLLRQGEHLVRSGKEWRWKRHDSVTIRGNRWYRHSTDQGGYPIDFIQIFFNKSFPESVTMLLNGEQGMPFMQDEMSPKEEKAFILPEANDTMRRVYAYLMKQRFISNEVITYFAHAKMLYEDKQYHNAIFVGCDETGIPKHAHKKGTYSNAGSFCGNVDGSDPKYSFRHIGKGDTLYTFEAPIDMFSFISIYPKDWQKQSYVTLDGISEHALLHTLEQNPHIQKIYLCLDHDPAGIEATYRLTEILKNRGYTDISYLQSIYKDWNEDLKAMNGYTPVPSQENPKITMFTEVCEDIKHTCNNIPLKEASLENISRLYNNICFSIKSGHTTQASDNLKHMAELLLISAGGQMRQIEKPLSTGQIINRLRENYMPHKDKYGLHSRLDNIRQSIQAIQKQSNVNGIQTMIERENVINQYLNLAKECIKTLSFIRLESQKQQQTPKTPTSQENQPSMIMM